MGRADELRIGAAGVSDIRKIGYVLGIAVFAAIVALLSLEGTPGWLSYGPLIPVFIFFALTGFVPDVGPPIFGAVFLTVYFLFASVLSLGLLLKHKYAWRVSATIFAILVLGNLVFFIYAWEFAMGTQGLAYTGLLVFVNLASASVAGLLLIRSKLDETKPKLLIASHALIVLWLSWASFPWLGEYL